MDAFVYGFMFTLGVAFAGFVLVVIVALFSIISQDKKEDLEADRKATSELSD